EEIFDSDILTLGKACVFQTLTDRGQEARGVAGSLGGEDPDHRRRRLLRARRKRRHRPCAAEKGDELPTAARSLTSSARARSVGGSSMPSAGAVGRLMTNWNLVDCTTGRSAGLAPLRMRPV